jgi:hypothetical protein
LSKFTIDEKAMNDDVQFEPMGLSAIHTVVLSNLTEVR